MVNALQFHDNLEDANYYNQFAGSGLSGLRNFVLNVVNGAIPPFIVEFSNALSDSFTVTIEAVYLDTVTQDITSDLTIVRAKNPSNVRIAVHKIVETVPNFGQGGFYLKVTGSDGITDDIIRYSDVMCSVSEQPHTFNVLDGGYNEPLDNFATVIDGGYNTV